MSFIFRAAALFAAVLNAAACAAWMPPHPPPFSGAPASPPSGTCACPTAKLDQEAANTTHVSGEAPHPPQILAAASDTDHGARTANASHIVVEVPYKLGERPRAGDNGEEGQWNRGDRGEKAAPFVAKQHALPRVVISVEHVRGALAAAEVERLARRQMWSPVVECFRLGAYRDAKLHGKTSLRLVALRSGKVLKSHLVMSEVADRTVPACIQKEMMKLTLPLARTGSAIDMMVSVWPGDEPMSPPEKLIVAGPGKLEPKLILESVALHRERIEACYRSALADAPALWGRLNVRLHAGDSGFVDEAFETESHFPDENVSICVLREMRMLKVSEPQGGDGRWIVPIRFWSDRAKPPHPPSPSP